MSRPDVVRRVLVRIARYRVAIILAYAVAVPIAAVLAMHIPNRAGIADLIVPSDPTYQQTRAFHEIFPEPQLALIVLETPDPWAPSTLARVDRATKALRDIPHVSAFSAIDALRRVRPGADPDALRQLATGTQMFRRQGLIGEDFVTLVVHLDVHGPAERDATLAAIDAALARADVGTVHRVGTPYINSWLEREAGATSSRAFAVFGVLLVAVTLFLFRSARALLAILLALGSSVALALAAGALLGFAFTVVSALVPLTVMVTTLATLTYLHSRFVDQPDDVSVAEHHVDALRSKLLPVTASTIAAATGFAALAVSSIQPIRQMGIWTAIGLLLAWLVAYTLFPALQIVLRTPTSRRIAVRSAAYDRVAARLPAFTYRHRRSLVAGALVLCLAGIAAITGVPGLVRGIPVEVDVLANINPASAVYRDTRWYRDHVMQLNVARLWIHLPTPSATDPEVLRAIDQFQTALEATPDITAVTGPTTPLRMRSYFAGHGEALPRDPDAFAQAVADVELLLLTEPDLRGFIDPGGLADVQMTVLFQHGHAAGYAALTRHVDQAWRDVVARFPVLAGARMHVVGEAVLGAKVGASLVPTLAESFLLTVAVILLVFLVVFRSGTERLLAMLPSLFALSVTFLGLRLFGGTLNVATIIIATTVLGTTENDQMHFFHHMHERAGAPLEDRLHYTLRIAGRAIVFATLINVVGFSGLATSAFPPLHQFGLLTAAAFALALIADFLALPAALWLASRSGPRPITE